MEKLILDKLCKQIYRQYPTIKGQTPRVTKQSDDRYLLVFSTVGKTPDGKSLQQNIRVTANAAGQIIKSSMSR